jgi:hypothetical protein
MEESNFDYRLGYARIGEIISVTIPDPSEITVEDAVRLLVRENNALRIALGLPTYEQLSKMEWG